VNATERTALVQGVQLFDEMSASIDERTLEILDHRRRTAVVRRRGWLIRRMLLLADILGLGCAFLLAELVSGAASTGSDSVARSTEFIVFVLTLPVWVVVAKLYGLYEHDEERTDHSTTDEFAGVFHMITVCTGLFAFGSYLTHFAHPTVGKVAVFWAAAIVLVSSGRASARTYCRRNVSYLQNTVIVGAGEVGQLIGKKLLKHPEYGMNLVGFVDNNPKERSEDLEHLTLLGSVDRLPALVRLFDIERVIIAFSQDSHERTLDLIRSTKDLDVQISIVPRLFEVSGPNARVHVIEGIPLLALPRTQLTRSSRLIKSALDTSLAFLGLAALSPLLAFVAVLIKLDSDGPVLYRHRRVGRNGASFDLLKFRTMHLRFSRGGGYGGKEAEQEFLRIMADPCLREEFEARQKLSNDPRVTRVGRFLRRTSIDELPQLWNVLRGELSLVGPRPITSDELVRYGPDGSSLLSIKPGITGYWQVNGRSALDYDDRVRLDLTYASSWSLRLDIAILGQTLRTLLARRGAL
jgi:exopolysaccharide biosynthesis polyprenyl glycosylphosphotransferase